MIVTKIGNHSKRIKKVPAHFVKKVTNILKMACFLYFCKKITMKLFTCIAILLVAIGTGTLYCNDFVPANNQKASISVYPNPVSNGFVTVTSDQRIEKVEILSILGEIVVTEDFEATNSVKLNLNLESGIYLIKVSFTNNTYNTKRIWVN
jgi:hypothetical protein